MPVSLYMTHLLLYPSLIPLPIHGFAHSQLPFFTPGFKLTSFTPVVSFFLPDLPSRTITQTVSSVVLVVFLVSTLYLRVLYHALN